MAHQITVSNSSTMSADKHDLRQNEALEERRLRQGECGQDPES